MDFIVDTVLKQGGADSPMAFTKILMGLMRDSKRSKFNTGDSVDDLFAFLKLREGVGSILGG